MNFEEQIEIRCIYSPSWMCQCSAFEIADEQYIARFRQRNADRAPYDPERLIDFILNRITSDRREFEIKPRMIELLGSARRNVYIEMAYLGDPDISRAVIAAANRGVNVTMLFSRAANVGNDINWRSLHRICDHATAQVIISDKMIHAKLMLVDDETVIAGSANFSVFSMQKAVELDVVVQGLPVFSTTSARKPNDGSTAVSALSPLAI